MPTPGEHETVQARILAGAAAIGWSCVSREEAEQRRGFDPEVPPADRAKNRSLFFDDLLDATLREFNPRSAGDSFGGGTCFLGGSPPVKRDDSDTAAVGVMFHPSERDGYGTPLSPREDRICSPPAGERVHSLSQ